MTTPRSSGTGAPSAVPKPAVSALLDRYKAERERLVEQFSASKAAMERARDVVEAWRSVSHFLGGLRGPKTTNEQDREDYVDRVMTLGSALRNAGLSERIQNLQWNDGEPRQGAIAVLRHALADDRDTVLALHTAMCEAGFGSGGDAISYFRNDLRHEILGTQPPVPVPDGWEGCHPDNEIRTPNDVVAWLNKAISLLTLWNWPRDERNDGKDVRDAYRLLRHVGLAHPYQFPVGPMTNGEAEAHLEDLRNVSLAYAKNADAKGVRHQNDHAHETAQPSSQPATNKPERQKASTTNGGAREKWLAALCLHHRYDEGTCGNSDPVVNNTFARAAGVSPSRSSELFAEHFGSHETYTTTCKQDIASVARRLKQLRGEFRDQDIKPLIELDRALRED